MTTESIFNACIALVAGASGRMGFFVTVCWPLAAGNSVWQVAQLHSPP